MSATQIAAALFQLQRVDLEMDRLAAEQQALASSLQSTSTLKKLRAAYSMSQQQLASGLQAQKEAEWALTDLEQRLRQQEQRLYDGSVTNAKELSALQQEVQHLRAQQARQEEATLEIMEAAESLHEEVARKELATREAEKVWEQSTAAGAVRQVEMEQRLQSLQEQRAKLAADLNEELLKRYEGLRKTRQGRVVSKVEQSSCQWCRVILTPSELQRVRVSLELQTCSNCGRILYYDR